MKTLQIVLSIFGAASVGSVGAQPILTVTQGEEIDLAATFDSTDLIQGLIPTELPGDTGWHPANTDPADQLPAFTDGLGIFPSGLTGLLNDFPGAGLPAKLIEYALSAPADINEIRVFTGNENRDGRVFHTYTVRFSSDWGATYSDPIYVQSHLSGTINDSVNNQWRVVLSQLTETGGPLATEVTHIEFDFYSVDNTLGEMRDPYDGINSFTGTDDLLTAAFVSPLVWEIDVLGADSPPRLSVQRSGMDLQLIWLSRSTNAVVQVASQFSPSNWTDLMPQPLIQTVGITNTTSVMAGSGQQFYRLRIED